MVFGIILVIIGFLYLLTALYPSFAMDYSIIWPTLLIVFSTYNMVKSRKVELFTMIIMYLGIWFFLKNISFIPDSLENIFWPIFIMIVGISILIESFQHKQKKNIQKRTTKGKSAYYGVFGGIEEKVKSKTFTGANVYAIFGGVDLDLKEVNTKEDIVLNIYSIFGGCDLKLPKGYNVKLSSSAFLGANENHTDNEYKEEQPTIYINCVSLFGGTEIK